MFVDKISSSSTVFVISLLRIRLVEVLREAIFDIDNELLALIERKGFIEALPHMNIISRIIHCESGKY